MDALLELIAKEVLAPMLKSGGPYMLFVALLATLFCFGGWACAYIVWRFWRKDQRYWRTTQTLRHDAHDRLVERLTEVLQQFIAAAREQRQMIGILLAKGKGRR